MHSRRALKLIAAALAVSTCLIFRQVSADSPSGALPSRPASYVHLDQNYNVIRRIERQLEKTAAGIEFSGNAIMTDADKVPRDVYLLEIPQGRSTAFELTSHAAVGVDVDRVTGPNGGRLFPVFADQLSSFQSEGQVVAKLQAFKLLGRDSWYLAESPEGYGGLFFKIVSPDHLDVATRAIEMTDYLQAGEKNLPTHLQGRILPEFRMMKVKPSGSFHSQTIIYRSAEVIHHPLRGGKVVPMHGFMGCETCVDSLARASGRTVLEWKYQVLIPAIAEWVAASHFILGASLEAHTQNLLMEVHEQTGAIELYARDLSDVLLNPVTRLAYPKPSLDIDWSRARIRGIAYRYWVEEKDPLRREIGFHTATYATQAVDSHQEGSRNRTQLVGAFAQAYLIAVNQLLGTRIQLSEKADAILQTLAAGVRPHEAGGNAQSASKVARRNAVAVVIEEIYQKGLARQMARVGFSHPSVDAELENEFFTALSKNQIVATSASAGARLARLEKPSSWTGRFTKLFGSKPVDHELRFTRLADQVVAIDKVSGSVIGATFTRPEVRSAPAQCHAFTEVTP